MKNLITISSFMLCIFVNTFAQNNTCPLYQKYINKGDTELAKGDKANFNEALKQYSNAMLHCPGKAKETREKIDKVYEKINQLNKNLERSKKEAERQRDRAKQQAQLAESEKQKAIAAKLEVESAKNHAEKEALLNKQISDAFLFYESNPTLALNNAQKILKESKSNPSGLQLTNFLLSRWPSPFYQNSFEEFPEYLESTSISPDGTIIATGGWDNRITLFDKSGTVKNVLMGHNDVIRDIKFSPDGKHILSGSNDNTAILWDREGNLIHHFKGHDGDVSCVAFSNNNKFILTGSWDHTSRLWSIDGNLIKIFEGKSRFEDLLFTPNDTGFISAGWDNEVIWWNTDGSIHKKFVHPSENIECLQLDKTGQYLLTGSWDNEIRLWDIHNNKIIEKFIGHTDKITSVLFWSDKYIISAGWDNTIRIWNINGNEIQKLVGHNHYVSNIALSKNKETIISSSWDKSIKTWHLPGLLISKFEQHEELPFAIAHSPVCNDFVSGDIKGNMFLWQNGKIPLRLKGHKDEINNIVYSHDGKFMLSSGRDNYAILWSKDGEKICSANPSDSDIKGIAFMKNKNNFVVGDRKGNVTIWDFNGTKKNSFITNEKFNTKINGYVLSPNNKQLLVYYENYLCIVYNLNGDEVLTYKGHKRQQGGRGIHKASFSPQGDAIVSTDDNNLIYMWDITGRDIATLKGHLSNVTNVCYSFDGSLFLTVSNDNSVKIWDKKGVNLQTIIPDNFKPTSACFTPDNKAVLINCYDNIIRKYYLIDSYLNSGKSYNGPTILNDEVIKKEDSTHTDIKNRSFYKMFDARIVTRELKLRTEKNWRLQYFLSMDYFNKFYFGETDYETPNRNEQLSSLEKAHELLKESGNLTDPKRLKPLPQEPGPQRYLRDVHVSLANQYILLKSPKKSIAIIKQLLIMPFSESNLDILNTNLAVAYLYNGDLQKCKNLIEPLKDREYNKKMTCKEMFIAKLDDFEKNGITHPDVNDMKKFLTNVIHSLKKK